MQGTIWSCYDCRSIKRSFHQFHPWLVWPHGPRPPVQKCRAPGNVPDVTCVMWWCKIVRQMLWAVRSRGWGPLNSVNSPGQASPGPYLNIFSSCENFSLMQFPLGSEESAQCPPVSSVIKETSESRSRFLVKSPPSDQSTPGGMGFEPVRILDIYYGLISSPESSSHNYSASHCYNDDVSPDING